MNEERCDGRCESCRFWEQRADAVIGPCRSKDVRCALGPPIIPASRFGCVFWKEREPGLREELAEYAHEAWRKHLMEKAAFHMPNPHIERWERQMRTAYTDLPEWKKESDRAEADKMIAIFEKHKS